MNQSEAHSLIADLQLAPHPEGGWYREIYRSPDVVQSQRGPRAAVTTIYYLLESGQQSRWHVVDSDEIWHFYTGSALELLIYAPGAKQLSQVRLGSAPAQQPVAVVARGAWQAAQPLGEYALLGCTVAPGFDFSDFRFVSSLPQHGEPFAGLLAAYRHLL